MPTRGQQFPLHNSSHFSPDGGGNMMHKGTHSIAWGAGAGTHHEHLEVEHGYEPGHGENAGQGQVQLMTGDNSHGNPRRTIASLQYKVQHAERATSMRVQPVIHTEMVDVHEDYQNAGLANHMMGLVAKGHPGVGHPASNELTEYGAPWRAHRVSKGLDSGERLAHGAWEGDGGNTWGPRIFRPAENTSASHLMEAGVFDPHDNAGEGMEHDAWVSRQSKIRKVDHSDWSH